MMSNHESVIVNILNRILFFTLIVLAWQGHAQTTSIHGKVTDKETGNPIPFATVVFKNTTKGATTDTLGNYKLSTKEYVDSVIFASVTYHGKTVFVNAGRSVELNVALKSDTISLHEVVIFPDEGPVRKLMKSIVDNKKQNNPDKYNRYAFRKYTKWEYHLNNLEDGIIQSSLFKKDPSLIKIREDSSTYLPLYFSEQLVYNEFQRNPIRKKSTILADLTSGVGILDRYEISGYTSGLDMEMNFYDNFINLFDLEFVSPLADNGWFYYKYFLADSAFFNGQRTYRVEFIPRRMGDNTFKGYLITETKKYSILEIDGKLVDTKSLNFLKGMSLKSNYQFVGDSIPFYKRNQLDAVFNYIPGNNNPDKNPVSFYFSQASTIDSVSVNQTDDVILENGRGNYETIKLPGAYDRDSVFWNNQRLEPLSVHEIGITATIDSINENKKVKVLNNFADMTITGFYDLGKFEFGPYGNIISINQVEGFRVFAGLRTSDEISKRYMIWGGLGYGTKNEKINGVAGFGYKFPHIHRKIARVSFDDKIIRTDENEKILFLYENLISPTQSNIISQVFRRDELDELYRERKIAGSFEYEWYPGLINKMSANYTTHFSPPFYPFLRSGVPVDMVSVMDFNIDTRFSWQEKMIDDKFMRMYMQTEYPIIHMSFGGGKAFYSGQENYYGRILGTIKQQVNFGQTRFRYAIEAGIYFGKLPYTMLDIPRGNETVGLYSYNFNMLNYMEFVHDKYVHTFLDYHLNGFIFNHIPLLKRFGLREVCSLKGMVGSLSDKHQSIVDYPLSVAPLINPYIELGAGVENVFRFFRVEGIWRVCPESVQGAPKFGIRVRLEVKL